jgi:hypothetical protein
MFHDFVDDVFRYKPQYPMITAVTLNESINMKIVTTRKNYREHWKFSILKEHVFHSPLEILLFNQKRFTSTIYAGYPRILFSLDMTTVYHPAHSKD